MKGLRTALGFLTILPVRAPVDYQPGDLGRAAVWFPCSGLLIGVLLGAGVLVLQWFLPPTVIAVVIVAFWAFVTGGLHIDGLADCGDGMAVAATPERRLEIMRDPRLGTFGGTALVLHLLLKVSLVGVLLAGPLLHNSLLALLSAPTIARWLILWAGRQSMARPGGLGADFSLGISSNTYLYAGVLLLPLLLLGGLRAVLALILAHLVMAVVIRLARNRLGGMTGDVLGLIVELGETCALLAFVVHLPF